VANISLLRAAKGRRGRFLRDNSGPTTISTLTVRWSSSNSWSPKCGPPQACRAGRPTAGKFPYRHTQLFQFLKRQAGDPLGAVVIVAIGRHRPSGGAAFAAKPNSIGPIEARHAAVTADGSKRR
jgi:hypothetical protein